MSKPPSTPVTKLLVAALFLIGAALIWLALGQFQRGKDLVGWLQVAAGLSFMLRGVLAWKHRRAP